MWRGCRKRCRPEIGYELICASRVRRRGWISGPARDESTDRFHAIDVGLWLRPQLSVMAVRRYTPAIRRARDGW